MITTREINVKLDKGKLKLRHVTTGDIDAGVRVEPPREPIKKKNPATISTTTLPDVADIAEKKRRDDIMAERKLAMKDEKKVVMAEKKIKIIAGPAIIKDEIQEKSIVTLTVPTRIIERAKKPWNKMNAKERKEYQAEKARIKKEEK